MYCVCLSGLLCDRAVYCVFGWCNVWKGSVLCAGVVYCVVWWCTVCQGDVLCVRMVYCVLGWCGRVVYYMIWLCYVWW